MAVGRGQEHQEQVYVTPEARERLATSDIWYHFGGWREDYDTYETEERDLQEDVDRFWADLVGPDEHLHRGVLSSLVSLRPEWQSVTISADGVVTVRFIDGSQKTLEPPLPANPEAAE